MTFARFLRTKRLILAAVMAVFIVCAFAPFFVQAAGSTVETYTDEAVPAVEPSQYDRYNSPMRAGQMTLQDVLKTHPAPQALRAPLVKPLAKTAQPPLLSPSSQSTSTNLMLQQGMKSVLQQSGNGKPTQLRAPVLGGAAATAAPTSIVAPIPQPIDVDTPPGVKFEPGQQPKNLAGTSPVGTTVRLPDSVPIAQSHKQTSSSLAPAGTTADEATPGCTPHTDHWEKSCVDAGYPESFVGKIAGETRTVCPDNALQDVWISNTCASPDEAGSANDEEPVTSPPTSVDAPETATQKPVDSALSPRNEPSSAEPRAAVGAVPAHQRLDASCGAANGLASNILPTSELCAFGQPTEVSGDGPWRWNCKGQNGGMTVSCAAPPSANVATNAAAPVSSKAEKNHSSDINVEDGLCGSSDGMGIDHAPAANLCARGVASRVNGSGPWTWACSGQNGGTAAACSASRKVDGACGLSGKSGSDQMPTENLCASGLASAVTGEGPWNWTCSGLFGGNPASCSAAPKKDAVCGSATLSGHRDAPKDNLCSVGQAGAVHGGGPWSWNCNGINSGAPVSCTAPVSVSGMCGNANGVAALKAPAEDLCRNGTATRVTGSGPWAWNCTGSDGGDTQSCTAPKASPEQLSAPIAAPSPVAESAEATTETQAADKASDKNNDLCGSASQLLALEAPDKDLCSSGKSSDVSGNGPWSWTCEDSGQVAHCSTLSPVGSFADTVKKAKPSPKAKAAAPKAEATVESKKVEVKQAACGNAADQGSIQAPVDGLCAVGKASTVHGKGPWNWSCVKDKSKASCQAPKLSDGACGAANGSIQKTAPVKGLCNEGTATEVQGNGPWLWTCVGTGGGSSISCSASSQAQTRVDGSCGAAANIAATTTPVANLCDSGVQSTVYGEGPWTWTCSGLNGGIAATCKAQKDTPAAPPPPGPAVNGLCGNSNGVAMVAEPVEDLCASGTATAVSGNGPWNWSCLGTNSGMTVSCTAPLQPPAPITGVCGTASGVPTLTMPRSALCSAGISSAVSGKGPWTWSCSGTNGGGAVGCVAPLAGTEGGSLPSLSSTPAAGEAPVPQAAPMQPVTSKGLITPRLKGGAKLKTEPLTRDVAPQRSFLEPPQPTASPDAPDMQAESMMAPQFAPQLPEDAALLPAPTRDNTLPPPAMKPPLIDSQGEIIPGNHFVVPEDISSLSFDRGSDNISSDNLPMLDKLAVTLRANSGVRITLTAYADNSTGVSPREARRLSLSRALAVRDYLTSKGISSGRIDVRALGANIPSGEPDRVDIKAN